MQRRQKASSRSNGPAHQKQSSPKTSTLPHRHHTKVRRVQKTRSKKSSCVRLFIQLMIVAIFVVSVISIYNFAKQRDHDGHHLDVGGFGNDAAKKSAKQHKIPHIDQTGDTVQQSLIQKFEGGEDTEQKSIPASQNGRRKRTTEEANAYMASHKTESVDGEIALKKKLVELYDLQKKSDAEDSSPIVTRWLGKDGVRYWLPKSSSSEAEIADWQKEVSKLKQDMREKDVENFPELHGKKVVVTNPDPDTKEQEDNSEKASDFAQIQFPSPTSEGTHPIIKPAFGKHRPHVDAIFALAEGYDLKIYLSFIESLKETGFIGDLVLSVSAVSELKKGVEEYLRSQQAEEGEDALNVIGYTVTWTCYEGDGVTVATGANEGVRKCALVDMYGDSTTDAPIKDPREPRPVATARYELYWAWSLHYDRHSWMMLIDSRDAYFQLNPFATVEREEKGSDRKDGLLYFFEENTTTNIGQSKFNSRWLNTAYDETYVKTFFEKPIICSGSTMGEQVAIESYLRGMVKQFDDTKCKLKGCDQGFHNYMYYSGGLKNVEGVREVEVFGQGKGIINNLGVLRSKPLKEWGLLDNDMKVLNWDKSVSPVAHQFDRDSDLNAFVKNMRKKHLNKYWAEKNS